VNVGVRQGVRKKFHAADILGYSLNQPYSASLEEKRGIREKETGKGRGERALKFICIFPKSKREIEDIRNGQTNFQSNDFVCQIGLVACVGFCWAFV